MVVLNREFLEKQYDKLVAIDVSFSNITKIDSSTFKGLKHIERLLLNDNAISEIEVDTFSDLDKLKELRLSNNNLKKIELKGRLDSLERLSLSRNQLEEVNFDNLFSLKSLYLPISCSAIS